MFPRLAPNHYVRPLKLYPDKAHPGCYWLEIQSKQPCRLHVSEEQKEDILKVFNQQLGHVL